jgi:flavin-dependent dehydrogenase
VSSCDVLIAGAGFAGVALASHLKRQGLDVIVLKRAVARSVQGAEVLATAALAEAAQLGWRSELESLGLPIYALRKRWGNQDSQTPSITDPKGPSLSILRADLDAFLHRRAAEDLALSECATLQSIVGGPDDWCVACNERQVRARHLVDATGRGARLARRLGARWISYDRLQAIATHPVRALGEDPILSIETAPDGWFYSVPTPQGLTITFMTDSDLIRSSVPTNALVHAPMTRERLDGTSPVWRKPRPAACGRLDRAKGEGWTAVDDAAQSWDPLSGSGIYRALASAKAAAARIANSLGPTAAGSFEYAASQNRDFSAHLDLRRVYYGYERRWPERCFGKGASTTSPIQVRICGLSNCSALPKQHPRPEPRQSPCFLPGVLPASYGPAARLDRPTLCLKCCATILRIPATKLP